MGSEPELCLLIDMDSSPGSVTFEKLLNPGLDFLIKKIAFIYYFEQSG